MNSDEPDRFLERTNRDENKWHSHKIPYTNVTISQNKSPEVVVLGNLLFYCVLMILLFDLFIVLPSVRSGLEFPSLSLSYQVQN